MPSAISVASPCWHTKASYEGKIAAEVIAGQKAEYDAMTVPSVAYTDPEIAWMGLTEEEAEKKGIPVEKSVFPWNASGRNLTMGRRDGLTKLLWDKSSKRLLGAAIAGTGAGELLSETTLAFEMGADLEDIALTIHPHPSLSETVVRGGNRAGDDYQTFIYPEKNN